MALVRARHLGDTEGFNAILAAVDGRPGYQSQLVAAFAYLAELVQQDWFLAEVLRRVPEQD